MSRSRTTEPEVLDEPRTAGEIPIYFDDDPDADVNAERVFTRDELDKIVRRRIARLERKHQREIDDAIRAALLHRSRQS